MPMHAHVLRVLGCETWENLKLYDEKIEGMKCHRPNTHPTCQETCCEVWFIHFSNNSPNQRKFLSKHKILKVRAQTVVEIESFNTAKYNLLTQHLLLHHYQPKLNSHLQISFKRAYLSVYVSFTKCLIIMKV